MSDKENGKESSTENGTNFLEGLFLGKLSPRTADVEVTKLEDE